MELPEQLPHRSEQPAEDLQNAILGALEAIPRLEELSTEAIQQIWETLACMDSMITEIEYVVTDELIYRGVVLPRAEEEDEQ